MPDALLLMASAGEQYETNYWVTCPMCDDVDANYVHLGAVRVQGSDRRISVTDDCRITPEPSRNPGRGSIVAVEMWCETGGHIFELVYRFHKGTISFSWEFVGSYNPEEESPRSLWRD